MDIGDHNCGLCRDYCRDPFPHSLLSTRESSTLGSLGLSLGGFGVELRSFRLSGLGLKRRVSALRGLPRMSE